MRVEGLGLKSKTDLQIAIQMSHRDEFSSGMTIHRAQSYFTAIFQDLLTYQEVFERISLPFKINRNSSDTLDQHMKILNCLEFVLFRQINYLVFSQFLFQSLVQPMLQ